MSRRRTASEQERPATTAAEHLIRRNFAKLMQVFYLYQKAAMPSNARQNINAQKIVATVAVSLFAIKAIAWYITGSIAIFTDAMESIVNVVGGFVGLYSLYLSAVPRDKNHPYGHGKVEFVSAGFEGALIAIAGALIIYKSILALISPTPLAKLDYGIYLVLFSAIVNYGVGYMAIRQGRETRSLALTASGKHLQSDTYTTLGIIAGLIMLKLTGKGWLDAVTAMVFAGLIIYQGVRIVRHALAGIMDEADIKLITGVIEHINQRRREQWVDLHNFRIVKYGAVYHIDCHLTVPWYITVKEAHVEASLLERLIVEKHGRDIEMSVHVEDCHCSACPICEVGGCQHRVTPFAQRIEWTTDNVVSVKRHLGAQKG
jgi:cation diffusion facilitator family transporter